MSEPKSIQRTQEELTDAVMKALHAEKEHQYMVKNSVNHLTEILRDSQCCTDIIQDGKTLLELNANSIRTLRTRNIRILSEISNMNATSQQNNQHAFTNIMRNVDTFPLLASCHVSTALSNYLDEQFRTERSHK